MKNNTFESYLEEIFCKQYTGLDDEMPDCMADWFTDLDPQDVIAWAEEWGQVRYNDGKIDGLRQGQEIAEKIFKS